LQIAEKDKNLIAEIRWTSCTSVCNRDTREAAGSKYKQETTYILLSLTTESALEAIIQL